MVQSLVVEKDKHKNEVREVKASRLHHMDRSPISGFDLLSLHGERATLCERDTTHDERDSLAQVLFDRADRYCCMLEIPHLGPLRHFYSQLVQAWLSNLITIVEPR